MRRRRSFGLSDVVGAVCPPVNSWGTALVIAGIGGAIALLAQKALAQSGPARILGPSP